MNRFKVVTTTAGQLSILDSNYGEIIHNPVGPWLESNDLYIKQSQFIKKITNQNSEALVLFDVGLGMGSNALAALDCALSLKTSRRKLKIVSFENDLLMTQFAIENSESFAFLTKYRNIFEKLLKENFVSGSDFEWTLINHDFSKLDLKALNLSPELVFFDPNSPKVNNEMWSWSIFKKIFELNAASGMTLLTYSQATGIRAGLLAAGFFVGFGVSTGKKKSTTIASTDLDSLENPLKNDWLGRWERSSDPWPIGLDEEQKDSFRQSLKKHPQLL